MSYSVALVAEQVEKFRSGEINLLTMWETIENQLDDLAADPYDDDKAERRVLPRVKH